ncbi:MAG: RsmB/NOP family class I SAM-dependent RNA methyltransferase [Hyphomicrobium sp.]
MRPGARVAAAMEIIETILSRHQPVPIALDDWGKAHRFAGSSDRNVIGHMVYDSLRQKAASAHVLENALPRALVLGGMRAQGVPVAEISQMCTGADHSPPALTPDEVTRLEAWSLDTAPPWVKGNYPEWLNPSFERAFGYRAADEGMALSARAPADLRVNTLRAGPGKVLNVLKPFAATACAMAPLGIRIPLPASYGRTPNLMAEEGYQSGWFEIQDEGSQIASALTCAQAGQQILDLCAGGGGKSLAMAAAMLNKGQIFAYDSDRMRLKPIFSRLDRAGVRNVQMLRGGDEAALDALGARFDLVLADCPCTGTGTWRRRPDAKWRIKPAALASRIRDQQQVLVRAARHVKSGGRLVYVTCSVLPEENTDQAAWFLKSHPEFKIEPFGDLWRRSIGSEPPKSADGREDSLLLTPASHGTDGFFIASFRKAP